MRLQGHFVLKELQYCKSPSINRSAAMYSDSESKSIYIEKIDGPSVYYSRSSWQLVIFYFVPLQTPRKGF